MQNLPNLRVFAALVVLSAVVAQGVPLGLGPRSEATESSHNLAAGSITSTSTGTQQVQLPAATVADNYPRISINDLLSPAPVPFDPSRSYPRQSIFSMDEIPGDLQKQVDECKDYREILKIAQVIKGKDDIFAIAKLRKMHPDDVLLMAMKIRRKALLRRAEEMKRRNQKLANLPSNLCQHYRQMITLAKRHGSKYVEDHTKQIIDNLERALNPKPRSLRWLDIYFSQCS